MATKSGRQGRIDDMNERALNAQVQMIEAQLPFVRAEQELIPLKSAFSKSALPKATEMLGKLPAYERINFDNPNVKAVQQRLDDNLSTDAFKAASKQFNTTGANREFGSSYQATREAELESLYNQQRNQNALTALQTGAGMYNQDINSGLALLGAYTGGGGSQLSTPNFSGMSGGGLGSMGSSGGGGSAMSSIGQIAGSLAPMLAGGLGSLGSSIMGGLGSLSSIGGLSVGSMGSLGGLMSGASMLGSAGLSGLGSMAAGAGGAIMGGLGAAGGALASGGSAAIAGIGALL